jgi:hypothetical protein
MAEDIVVIHHLLMTTALLSGKCIVNCSQTSLNKLGQGFIIVTYGLVELLILCLIFCMSLL